MRTRRTREPNRRRRYSVSRDTMTITRPFALVASGLAAALIAFSAPGCAADPNPGLAPDATAHGETRAERFARPDPAFPIRIDADFETATISITRRAGVEEIALDYEVRAAKTELLEDITVKREWMPNGTLRLRAFGPVTDKARRWTIARLDLAVPNAEHVAVRTGSGSVFLAGLGRNRPHTDPDNDPHRVATASGAVGLTAVDGPVMVRTSSGDITLTRGAGNAVLTTASGNVSVDRRAGLVDAETSSGDITLLAASRRFELDAHSGNITATLAIDFRGRVRAEAPAGDLRNDRPAPPTDLDASTARTAAGNVTVIAIDEVGEQRLRP